VAEVGQQLPSGRFHGWHCLMPFANDDGRPLGLLVLMRLVSSSTAISRSTPSVPDVGKECSPMWQHTKPDTFLAATTGTGRFTTNSGTLPSQAKK
jgi:hypothetical protein